ncbi:protein of unknown function [Xenorhabdus poinarii G6]|uniref:Uncharacterized protein n=1 Tax=Xenorhabdus poinarii G6 TaxID=1354304 RepID=A0A068R115_9GAMM|nr:protein of unknown function [Xenorhabdus poinarii G6]
MMLLLLFLNADFRPRKKLIDSQESTAVVLGQPHLYYINQIPPQSLNCKWYFCVK